MSNGGWLAVTAISVALVGAIIAGYNAWVRWLHAKHQNGWNHCPGCSCTAKIEVEDDND